MRGGARPSVTVGSPIPRARSLPLPRVLRHLPLLAVIGLVDLGVAAEGLSRATGAPRWHEARDAAALGRFVVLGFDGADPRMVRKYVAEGAMPTFERLMGPRGDGERPGALFELESEIPPESPVAWASLMTGMGPAWHGLFDFVDREPGTYQPGNGLVGLEPARFLFGRLPVRPPRITSKLAYPTFPERVAAAGYRVLSLRQPLAFPVKPLPGTRMLAGLGTPDLAGTNGSYAVYDAGFGFGRELTVFNGHQIHLDGGPDARAYDTYLEGPYDRSRPAPGGGWRRVTVPLRFERAAPGGPVTVVVGGVREEVAPGASSTWMRVPFEMPTWPRIRAWGRVRFEVKSKDPRDALRVLASPVQIDALDPALAVSQPGTYAAELEKAYGASKTMGWMEPTFQLNDGNTTPDAFLKDLLEDMDHDAAMVLGELRRGAACVFSVCTQTDRAAHCFWWLQDPKHPFYDPGEAARIQAVLGDPLRTVYARMDRIVGDVLATLSPEDVLLVVSDHGFRTWRRGMNVNQWLLNEGYLVATADTPERKLGDFFGDRLSIAGIDWARSRAYALGLGQIYLNREGREPEGIVKDEDVPALLDEMRAKLLAYRDAEGGGSAPVAKVYKVAEIYRGPHMGRAAELQLAFAEGYRVSWQTALLGGLVQRGGSVCEDNRFPWSGDHCSTDRDLVPGILLSNRFLPPAPASRPYGVKDVAATVLEHFHVEHAELEGKPLPLAPPPAVGAPGTSRPSR